MAISEAAHNFWNHYRLCVRSMFSELVFHILLSVELESNGYIHSIPEFEQSPHQTFFIYSTRLDGMAFQLIHIFQVPIFCFFFNKHNFFFFFGVEITMQVVAIPNPLTPSVSSA